MLMGDNGQYYTLTMGEDGMWMAMHNMPDPVSVMLGMHGGMRMLQQAEDGSWWYGEDAFMDGGMLMGDNGQYYTLTMDDDGMWMAMHNMLDPVMVTLGTSGTVMLQQAEDNSWWIGEMAFASGDTYTAANGNDYMLTYHAEADDPRLWHAEFQPMSMMIERHEPDGHVARGPDGLRRDGVGGHDSRGRDGRHHRARGDVPRVDG